MRKLAGETMAAIIAVGFAAGFMELLWWLTKFMGGPIDRTFIGAAAICYVVYRTARDEEF